MEDVFNTPLTCKVEMEVLGHKLLLSQNPNSQHLGTTIWDSSVVFVKYLERNSKKGEFSRVKLHNKRVVEVGAGCGLSGLGMALLGCDVVVTDQAEVLPILRRNMERNMARAKYSASEYSHLGPIGSVEVSELDWGNQQQAEALNPPFDYIIGTDVVYKEYLLPPLLESVLALSGPKTTLLLGYEFRASGVEEQLKELFSRHFTIKKVPHAKMDVKYQHGHIDLYIMRLIRPDSPAHEECNKSSVEQECPSSQEPTPLSFRLIRPDSPTHEECNESSVEQECPSSQEPTPLSFRLIRPDSPAHEECNESSVEQECPSSQESTPLSFRLIRPDSPAHEECNESSVEQECPSSQERSASTIEPDEANCSSMQDSTAVAFNGLSLEANKDIPSRASFPDPDGTEASISERWEAGRTGSMAARLLRDVKIPPT